MLSNIIDWSGRNRFLVLLATAVHRCLGHLRRAANADRRPARSLRRAGHRLHRIPGPGPAGRGGPGHLPADHRHAVGAEVEGGARLFLLRRVLRLHHLRGRHRHLLGPLARAGVPELRSGTHAQGHHAADRPGRHRRGLGLPVRAAGQGQDAGRAALDPGLVCALPADQGARRGRSGLGRRLRADLPGHGRPGQAARLRHPA